MERKLEDLVVVITGASSGIGRATALHLAERKATVVLASRQENVLQELAQECERLGGRALAVKTDVTDESQVQNLARRAVEAYGRIDGWVNDAAVTMLSKFEKAPADTFRRVMDTNFFGTVHGARAVLPCFREQGRGVLINLASVLGKVGSPYASAYVASKFAITGFAESLRMELADWPDIHVCTVLPASIDTPLFQHAANFTGRSVRAMPPVFRPERVAEVIADCLVNPRQEVTVGDTRKTVALRTVAPRLSQRVYASKVHRQHFSDAPTEPTRGNVFEPMPGLNTVHGGWLSQGREEQNPILLWSALAAGLAVMTGLFLGSLHSRRPKERGRPNHVA